ncbi:hypothetical protein CCR91_03370 [Thiorhodovibrio winogradskyi]|nr:hypothetical protein [Thiorhodovibrio winogradskyi]
MVGYWRLVGVFTAELIVSAQPSAALALVFFVPAFMVLVQLLYCAHQVVFLVCCIIGLERSRRFACDARPFGLLLCR